MARALPAIVLATAILLTSGSWASSEHTSSVTSPWLTALGFSREGAVLVHNVVRKLGHAMAYALFAVLALRAVRMPTSAVTRRLCGIAWLLSVALASGDETLQSFAPARGGHVYDVLIDSTGAALAMLVAFRWSNRRAPTAVPSTTAVATDPEAA